MTTLEECTCRCHAHPPGSLVECNVDDGSTGVPGKKSCGYHESNSEEATAINVAKFRDVNEVDTCRQPHGKRRQVATFGRLCDRHASELRDLMADVNDLWDAYTQGDAITPERAEYSGKRPHPPIPINLNAFLIANPGHHKTVGILPERNANPVTWRIESNGPDAPHVRALAFRWAEVVNVPDGWFDDFTLGAIGHIRQHLEGFTHLDDEQFYEFLHDMRNCRRALAAAIGQEPGPQSIAKCPACGTPLYTDRDHEIIRRRRAGELITGEDAAPITARGDRVACNCHPRSQWEGAGLIRLKLMSEAS